MITYEELKKGPIKIGKIKSAKKISGADKLLLLKVDFGTEEKQVVAGMAQHYKQEEMVGKVMPFVVDIPPVELMGAKSEAMILAPHTGVKPVFLIPEGEVEPGTAVF